MEEWFVVEERRGDIFFDAYGSEESAKDAMVWDYYNLHGERERMEIREEKSLYVVHNASGEEVGSGEWFDSIDEVIYVGDVVRERDLKRMEDEVRREASA